MKLFSKDGIEMMDVKSISHDKGKLVIKGKMMGAMAATIYVKPEDMWDAFCLFPAKLVLRMPVIMLQGFWRSKKNAKINAK
jgi:hypothetical protein